MLFHTPEEWLLVKIDGPIPHYRVFGSWRGGYLSGDSWRMNSGVTSVEEDGNYYLFHGESGSVYKCHKKAYGIKSPHNNSVLANYKAQGKNIFNILVDVPNVMEISWSA